jgi:PKD repeat protein
VPLTGTSASFADVPSGTYYLTLTASNSAGTSSSSTPVTVVVGTITSDEGR